MRAALLGLAVALVAGCAPAGGSDALTHAQDPMFGPTAAGWRDVEIASARVALDPEAPKRSTFGRLRFRGGLVLSAEDPAFGGFSGLYVSPEGTLLAISDRGAWLGARLLFDRKGDLVGVTDGVMAQMRDESGRAFTQKGSGDAEDLARLPDGRFAVSFEQIHAVRIYDLPHDGPEAPADALLQLAGVGELGRNQSLEAMGASGDRLVIGAEMGGKEGPPFWIATPIWDASPEPAGHVVLKEGLSLTGLASLPGGDLLSLERFYLPLFGARARIARMPAAALQETPPAWRVEELADLQGRLLLDNFEGISAVAGKEGAARIYVISDDNFRTSQRTLLYAFELPARAQEADLKAKKP